MELHAALRLGLDPNRPDVISVVGGGGKSSAVFRIARDLSRSGRRAVITHTARIAAFQTAWAPAVIEVPGAEAHAGQLPLEALRAALATYGVCLLTGPIVGDRRAGLLPASVDALAAAAPDLGIAAITVEADGSKMRPAKAPAEHEPVLPSATTLLVPVLGLDAVAAPIDDRSFHRAELVRRVLGVAGGAADVLPAAGLARLTPRQAAELLLHPAGGAKACPPGARLLPIFNKADSPARLLYGRLAARSLLAAGQASLLTTVGNETVAPVVERWGQVAVVILAAGAASRFGRPKQLEFVGGAPMLLHAVAAAATLGGPVVVVTGAHAEQVYPLLESLPGSLRQQLQVVYNQDWEVGQASSLHTSLRSLPAAAEAAIWMPVDQPYLDPLLLAQLAAAWRRGADLAAPQVEGELRGAPALFDRRFWPELLTVAGDRGGRAVLQRYAAHVEGIPTTGNLLRDIDYPSDLT